MANIAWGVPLLPRRRHLYRGTNMVRIVVLVVLFISVLGLAHAIETQARPSTGREGHQVGAEGMHQH